MGTRSLTIFEEPNGEEIAVLYRQYDGYPEGHGKELAAFLQGFVMVNGIGDFTDKIANGMGCLSAQVLAHFKTKPGLFYLMPAGTRDVGEEYIYVVSGKERHEPFIKIFEVPYEMPPELQFSGTATECFDTMETIEMGA